MSQKYLAIGFGYSWWRGDPLPELPALAGFQVAPSDDSDLLARLHQLPAADMEARLNNGNEAYLGYLDQTPVAYGWSARKTGVIKEVGLEWPIPPGERHLWDFKTRPEWRGLGVYPHLLQAIIRQEREVVKRFWIGHQAGNEASRRGIIKAGFLLGQISVWTPQGVPQVVRRGNPERAKADPLLRSLGLEVVDLPDEQIDFQANRFQ